VDVVATVDAGCSAERLFAVVEDLGGYPAWLDIVPRAVAAAAHPGDPGPAWTVDLRGRLGPFARSKRLRMVRTAHQAPELARFERLEHDERRHSPWVLTAEVEGTEAGSRLTMRLHYGGGLFGPVLERLLAEEIERSRPRLLALVGSDSG
jgi:hypothetical protein